MTWLKVKEAARLLDLTDSAIKKAIKKNKYEYRHVEGIGRGGVQIEIALESRATGSTGQIQQHTKGT